MLEKIKQLCKEKNVSMERLEAEAGMSKNSIYRWDRVSPSIKYVVSVADYLGVSVDELLGRTSPSFVKPDRLDWVLSGMNQEGIEMVTNYADFILSQPQYKKYNFSGVVEKSS